MIVLARVDSRLIHGQILEGWIPYAGPSLVIVADNCAASDPFQKKMMEMAVPDNVRLKVESIDEAVEDLKGDRFTGERVMVIFSTPHDAFEACQKGIGCESINLGNLSYTSGKKQVTPSIALGDDDVNDIKALINSGVRIDVRSVPRERERDIEVVIEHYIRVCKEQY